MDDKMIERVARAICRAGICGPKDHLNEQVDKNWRKFEIEAKDAIKAMREPTSQMINDGIRYGVDYNFGVNYHTYKELYQSMIDSVLGD